MSFKFIGKDRYSRLMDLILKGLQKALECPSCKKEIPFMGFHYNSITSHLNCVACGNSLKRMEMCCPYCNKIVLDSTYCEHCGFNKPEWVTKLLEFYK